MELVNNQCPCLLCAVLPVVLGQVATNGLFQFIVDLLSDLSHSSSRSWGVHTFCLLSTFEVADLVATVIA